MCIAAIKKLHILMALTVKECTVRVMGILNKNYVAQTPLTVNELKYTNNY